MGKEKLWEWLFLTYIVLYSVCGRGMKGVTMTELRPLEITDVVHALRHYEVKHCDFPLSDMAKSPTYGLTDLRNKKIYINSETYGREKIETIIHELVHAYYETLGVVLNEKDTDKVTRMTLDKHFKK